MSHLELRCRNTFVSFPSSIEGRTNEIIKKITKTKPSQQIFTAEFPEWSSALKTGMPPSPQISELQVCSTVTNRLLFLPALRLWCTPSFLPFLFHGSSAGTMMFTGTPCHLILSLQWCNLEKSKRCYWDLWGWRESAAQAVICVGLTRSEDTTLFKSGAVAFGPFSAGAVGESGKLF